MGETRVRKSKKTSKGLTDASKVLDLKIEHPGLSQPEESVSEIHTPSTSITEDESIPDPNLIEIQNTEEKGLAVFAAQKITAGTLLLAEKPLIRLTQPEEDTDKSNSLDEDDTALNIQFTSLAKTIQKLYLKLFDSEKSGYSKVKSIYYSNCYNLSGANKPSKSSPGGSCIGLVASRINHSCIPNVQFSYDEDRNLMLFYAIKAIPKGRELGSNYDSIYELRSQRQRRQMLYYGFRCDCEACNPGQSEFWMRSDERRRAMIEIRKDLKDCDKCYEEAGKLDVGQEPIVALEKLEGLLIKEGVLGVPLMDTYKSLARWAERLGDVKATMKWRQKELTICICCLGSRSARVRDLTMKLSQVV